MLELLEANLPAVALAVALVIVALLFLLRGRGSKPRERHRAPDALDEGTAPAARNQALIDAPSAVTSAMLADTGPDILAGMGELLAFGAAKEVEAAAPPPPPPPVQAADDLSRIKGLGPKLQALLASLGVSDLTQIAAWSEADIDRIDAQLGTFAGRIRKDNWVEQAKFLAAGDVAGYERKFGKL